jgi:hypothetical protein
LARLGVRGTFSQPGPSRPTAAVRLARTLGLANSAIYWLRASRVDTIDPQTPQMEHFLRRSFIILTLAASFTGCSPSPPNAAELSELAALAPNLLMEYQSGFIPADKWPAATARLKPEHVMADSTGLYIAQSSFFVIETELFVPRAADFSPKKGTDPTYVPLTSGVFSYRISG